ncbi:MAG TPA: hypothetical protein VHB25_01740 [Gemmatimonadaceae bacterium]|nr:hypothetical protein [Gemmatimonadaceae bacterium]
MRGSAGVMNSVRSDAVSHDHHERGVRLVEVREVVKRRQLMKRAEVGDRRSTAERDHDAVADASGQRIAACREFAGRDLRGEWGRGAGE